MGKDIGIAGVLLVGWQWAEVQGWIGWIVAALALGLYIRIRLSDPFAKIEKLTKQVKQLLEALAEEKVRVMDLTNRNDELRTLNNRLKGDLDEMRGEMKSLKVAFEKNGETIARLAEDLKEERKLRDDQFMQWTRERAKYGEL